MRRDVMGDVECDLLVIGGGINGAGIARDAAGRGLSVVLCERDDLASHTSSASTKLVHGGLRYLEQYAFGLVRKALRERESLLRIAPHIISPLRFVLPRTEGGRPAWMIRAGLFLYDHLAPRALLPASGALRLDRDAAGVALAGGVRDAFTYSDAWVDDARLVVLNALDAAERGARIFTRTACTELLADGIAWRARLEGEHACTVRARSVVNAGGPWAGELARLGEGTNRRSVRLVKGSHIVVPRLFAHASAYLFQHPDGRVVFAIPYQDEFTLIGTTDLAFEGDPAKVRIDAGEIDYLCALANQYFRRQVSAADVVWSYSGVRPLLDDGSGDPSAVTRDYLLEWAPGVAPMLHVWGGKITTYRKLAEQAIDMLGQRLGATERSRTAAAFLPGGDLAPAVGAVSATSFAEFSSRLRALHPWLPEALAQRYARNYGTRTARVLAGARSMQELGELVAPGLYECELRYLADVEWARCADDVLWRRTKQGLRCTAADHTRLASWLAAHCDAMQVGARGRVI